MRNKRNTQTTLSLKQQLAVQYAYIMSYGAVSHDHPIIMENTPAVTIVINRPGNIPVGVILNSLLLSLTQFILCMF